MNQGNLVTEPEAFFRETVKNAVAAILADAAAKELAAAFEQPGFLQPSRASFLQWLGDPDRKYHLLLRKGERGYVRSRRRLGEEVLSSLGIAAALSAGQGTQLLVRFLPTEFGPKDELRVLLSFEGDALVRIDAMSYLGAALAAIRAAATKRMGEELALKRHTLAERGMELLRGQQRKVLTAISEEEGLGHEWVERAITRGFADENWDALSDVMAPKYLKVGLADREIEKLFHEGKYDAVAYEVGLRAMAEDIVSVKPSALGREHAWVERYYQIGRAHV